MVTGMLFVWAFGLLLALPLIWLCQKLASEFFLKFRSDYEAF